ncbi:MAG: hypothetical protein GX369_05400 [Euryarchaeota archaeon]|nr:hypothetical protein [Euryarchaeota archaeon]
MDETIGFNEAYRTLSGYGCTSREGRAHTLYTRVGLSDEEISSNGVQFKHGMLYFHDEHEISEHDMGEDGTIEENRFIRRRFHAVPFTLVSNPGLIMFNNTKQPSQNAKAILSEILYGMDEKVNAVEYNIQAIEADLLKGQFSGLWTVDYKDRQGPIKKGRVYGDDIDQDAMYGQVAGAPRNNIGIKMMSGDKDLKVNIYRTGNIAMFAGWNQPQDVTKIYEIVEALRPYQTVKG